MSARQSAEGYEVVSSARAHHVYFGSIRVASCKVLGDALTIARLLNTHGSGDAATRANGLASESRKRDGIAGGAL